MLGCHLLGALRVICVARRHGDVRVLLTSVLHHSLVAQLGCELHVIGTLSKILLYYVSSHRVVEYLRVALSHGGLIDDHVLLVEVVVNHVVRISMRQLIARRYHYLGAVGCSSGWIHVVLLHQIVIVGGRILGLLVNGVRIEPIHSLLVQLMVHDSSAIIEQDVLLSSRIVLLQLHARLKRTRALIITKHVVFDFHATLLHVSLLVNHLVVGAIHLGHLLLLCFIAHMSVSRHWVLIVHQSRLSIYVNNLLMRCSTVVVVQDLIAILL